MSVVTNHACIWSLLDWQGLQPPSPRGGRGCLRGLVGATKLPRFLRLLKPAITDPFGNNLLLKGSRYRVVLLLRIIAAMSGLRGFKSVTRTNFFCPPVRPRRGRKKNIFVQKFQPLKKNPNPYISQHNSETNLHNYQAQVQVQDR